MDVRAISLRSLLCEGSDGAVINMSDKARLVVEDLVAARVITLEIFIPEGKACRPIRLFKHLNWHKKMCKNRKSRLSVDEYAIARACMKAPGKVSDCLPLVPCN